MTELLEYTMAVMVSTLLVAGSVMVYGGFNSFESGLTLRAAFGAVSSLASKAVENGSAEAKVPLPSSTITCSGGVLTLEVGGASLNESLHLDCSFGLKVSGGVHMLRFTYGSSWLTLSVK